MLGTETKERNSCSRLLTITTIPVNNSDNLSRRPFRSLIATDQNYLLLAVGGRYSYAALSIRSIAKMQSRLPEQEKNVQYDAPAIIYEGKLTTRAGTPPRAPFDFDPAGFDPSLLFGDSD